ncbi:MAG: carbon monoxide dehydrogenase subunit G [Burkholderiales bacterium]|nr:carbon monoxide dehydrogenase subunit G [Burkholderiales bacterium]
MELTGSQTLPVSQAIAWDALNDPEILKAAITGCDELLRVSDTEFSAAVTSAIGPVKARFKAKLTLSEVDAPHSYKIRFDGQGGAAGFGKGEAKVRLTPEGAATRLDYTAQASVGGKLAQIGSRLVDAAAKKLADDFFTKFNAELARRFAPAAPAAAAPAVAATAPAAGAHPGDAGPGTLIAYVVALLAILAGVAAFLARG